MSSSPIHKTPGKVEFAPYLNVKNALAGRISADGTRLYYLSDHTGTFQLWSVPIVPEKGTWPDQLTFFEERVSSYRLSPVSDEIILTRDLGGNEQDQLFLLRGGAEHGVEIVALAENPKVKHNFGVVRPDGGAIAFSSNQRDPAHFDLYTLAIRSPNSTPQLVYQANATLYATDWSHSGRYLLFARYNTNLDNDLFLLDLYTPGSEPKLLTAHSGPARFENAKFSADDERLYLVTDAGRDFTALVSLDLATLELTTLVAPSWDVEAVNLSPDGKLLAYTVNQEGYTTLYVRDLTTHSEKIVGPTANGKRIYGEIAPVAWSADSHQLTFDFCSPAHNYDVWIYEVGEDRCWQVTHSPRGGLNPATFVTPDPIHYPTFDSLQIPALWYLPSDAHPDKQTPVILYVHGGPESQTRFLWSPLFQYLTRRGYAVLAPNVRGSAGYGKHYLSLDDVRKRPDSVHDLKYAVEWLRQNPYVAANKIAVYGGSYGGFMVLAALTSFPDLWAAGVDIVGIANMLTFLENTSSYRRHLRIAEYGDPVIDRDFLIEVSPVHKVDRIAAPLMVIHGAQDPRVPVSEAEQIVDSLRQRNHPVSYLRFEDEGHGIVKLTNRLVCYPQIADFLDQHLMI